MANIEKVKIGTSTYDVRDAATATNLSSHTSNKSNPHEVTKSQVGLGSVVNTGDSETPVSGGTTKFTTGGAYTELAKKQDKLTAQTAYAAKGSATKVPQITTNNLGQVTAITEIDIPDEELTAQEVETIWNGVLVV